MSIAAFARLTQSVLNRLGDPARLRGEVVDPVLRVNIERAVEIMGIHSESVLVRDVATFPAGAAPKKGDLLEMLDISDPLAPVVLSSYKLDAPLANTGYSIRYTLLAV
jgi:hypothetical protein